MKTIPELRAEMISAAEAYRGVGLSTLADEIDGWVNDLYRRSPVRRARAKSYARPDPEDIRFYADSYPNMSYMDIAMRFGCSIGRVSEALAGFRE